MLDTSTENKTYRYTPDIEGYQNAVWDFLLEHSDISGTGKYFIKFGCDGKKNFENRVYARWKYNYHREDVEAKAARAEINRIAHQMTKKEKKEAWKRAKKERIALLKMTEHDGKPIEINSNNFLSVFKKAFFKK